ncbi:MAG: homoserine kinase [Fluviicoccus sp.]|uniref:homoserine kinase n=1 Tax=Fluviicoccus sp. TaxID=2003552 RepID=UPI00271CFEC2|nr:homoserine kinase [Fluviicoccus sp.]MDO8332155.1 homoserine kinase [Fluviicoccus sp.]
MSVYTELTLDEIRAFAADHYGLTVTGCDPIASGIENTNYFVRGDDGREFVLTLFEELNAAEAAFLPPLLQHLQREGVPVAGPLVAKDGKSLLTLRDKPVQLAPRIIGGHPSPVTVAHCAAIGEALAKLHLGLEEYPLHRENTHGQEWWEAEANKARKTMGKTDQLLLETILEDFEETVEDYEDLPMGLIHGDLFRDNTLFEGEALRAILDFSEAGEDYWLLDVAITINDFCSAWPSVKLDQDLYHAFLRAYNNVRPLTADEQEALPAFLGMAATRFWLSRLSVAARNAAEGRTGEAMTQKDPNEMKKMVAARMMGE